MHETTASINRWIKDTFGSRGSRTRYAARANEEMAELLRAVTDGTPDDKICEECADVAIVLFRLCEMHNGDLLSEIDSKMKTNRNRDWAVDASGCGYHLKQS